MLPLDTLGPLSSALVLSRGATTTIGVCVLVVLLALSAFFSSAEIAMFSIARHRVDALAASDTPGAATLADLLESPHALLTTILVGNNLANVAMSSLATSLLGYYLSQGRAVVAATLGVTTIVLLFGESAPKSYAVEHTESWALRTATPLATARKILAPLVVLFARLTRLVNRIVGDDAQTGTSTVSRDEIRELVQAGERQGAVSGLERDLADRALRISETIAKEAMTPRPDVVAVPATADIETAIERCLESGHERLPLVDETLDDIVGTVSLTTLVAHQQQQSAGHALAALADDVRYIPETKPAAEMFELLRDDPSALAVVVDEFGTTEGIVTAADFVDLVVGPEFDPDDDPSIVVDGATVYAHGATPLDEVNVVAGVTFPERETFETVAGFVLHRAGRLVDVGEEFTYEDATIRIESVDRTRIERVRIDYPTTEGESQ